jgi:DNA repair protein RAD50
MQGELDRLSGVRTSALATKRSKQEQIVRMGNVTSDIQAKLNDKIRHSEATFESVSSVDVEIEMLEQKIAEAEDQRARLQNDIRDAKYDEQMREKTLAIRHKEAEKDKVQAELSALNRQADSRAQLSIKKGELTAKTNQIAAS